MAAKQKTTKKRSETREKAKKEIIKLPFKPPLFKIPVLAVSKNKKMPRFEFSKESVFVEFPKGKDVDITYSLIKPFITIHIFYDKKTKEMIYEVKEPIMNEKTKEIYEKITESLFEVISFELSAVRSTDKIIPYLEDAINQIINQSNIKVEPAQYSTILYYIWRNFVGMNEIEALLQDPYIEDISCDGTNIPVYIVHRKYGSLKTNISFSTTAQLENFVMKLAERCGRYISYAEPLLDGTLPDGSRVQASIAQDVTTRGPSFTIRKFRKRPYSPVELIELGTASPEIFAYLWLAVENGASILITGGTGTGKTSFLNALSIFVRPNAKIVSIEDTRELQLPHENWLAAVTRTGFGGYGEVTLFDLLKESFRQSPDYVIIGEVRGKEAYVLFQGMAAGIPALGTMHAGRVEDLINRLKTPPIELSPSLIETLDIIVLMIHAHEKGANARRIRDIVEIEAVDPNTGSVKTNNVFSWISSEDKYEFRDYSWVLQKMSGLKGVSIEELQQDLKNRSEIIKWAMKNNIRDFEDFTKLVRDFYVDAEALLKKVKK